MDAIPSLAFLVVLEPYTTHISGIISSELSQQ